MFRDWLDAQRKRTDDLGSFARSALADPKLPRRVHELHILLKFYDDRPPMRLNAKRAHAEWRKARDGRAVAE